MCQLIASPSRSGSVARIEVVGGLGGLGDGLDVLLVLLDQLVAHGEAVLGIDRAFLGHQIADMAVGGEDDGSPCRGIC